VVRDIIVAVPNKGRLKEPSVELLSSAGIRRTDNERVYLSNTTAKGVLVLSVRANDIPTYVYHGIADLGVTGRDIVAEGGFDVYELSDLGFGRCDLVVAVKKESPWKESDDIPNNCRVATEFPNLTMAYFNERGVQVEVIPLRGAVEIAPILGLADAITDLTVSGSTLERNGLRPIGKVLASTARLICNKISYKTRYDEIESLVESLGCA
jgi:ATP phosphoribosyltransferase